MRQGPTPRRVRELSQHFRVDRRTIARWQVFWREHFPQTPFWKIARARFEPAVEIVSLPYSLVDAFLQPLIRRCEGWTLPDSAVPRHITAPPEGLCKSRSRNESFR